MQKRNITNNMISKIERRKYLRLPLSLPLEFKEVSSVKIKANLTRDLSMDGIKFLSTEFIPVNSFIKIRLNMQKASSPVECIVKIAWIRSVYDDELFEVGASICDISRDSFGKFKEFISHNVK